MLTEQQLHEIKQTAEQGCHNDWPSCAITGALLLQLVGECRDFRQLLDAARCRITALEEAGLFEIAGLVRRFTKGLP